MLKELGGKENTITRNKTITNWKSSLVKAKNKGRK